MVGGMVAHGTGGGVSDPGGTFAVEHRTFPAHCSTSPSSQLVVVDEIKGTTVAITEETRFQLFQRSGQVLGTDEAATLMELLPPVGWADVATKRDLDQQRVALAADINAMGAALRTEMGELRGEMRTMGGDLRAEMYREQRNSTLAIIGANTALAALVVAALQLF